MLGDVTRRACLMGGLAALILVFGVAGRAMAQSADVVQSQDTNIGGLVGEITQVKRKEGVITVKLRLRNTSGTKANVYFTDGYAAYDKYYVTAGDKKYFVLRDSEGVPLATDAQGGGYTNIDIAKDASYTWWAKFPAPPAEVTSVTFYSPVAPPFEDLPITD